MPQESMSMSTSPGPSSGELELVGLEWTARHARSVGVHGGGHRGSRCWGWRTSIPCSPKRGCACPIVQHACLILQNRIDPASGSSCLCSRACDTTCSILQRRGERWTHPTLTCQPAVTALAAAVSEGLAAASGEPRMTRPHDDVLLLSHREPSDHLAQVYDPVACLVVQGARRRRRPTAATPSGKASSW